MNAPFAIGLDVLLTEQRAWLARRRVGLVSHQAALDRRGATAAQRLRRELGARLVALFGPEHGFFGQAGAGVATYTRRHPDWGIPVHALYGAQRKPTAAMLRGVETLVFDLQDLGARCYTYLATLRNVLEAATENGVAVIVADRPTPLPRIVDGPPLEPAYASFVAPAATPLATGLTPGEAARWLTRELNLKLDLKIAAMRGWRRDGRRGADWPDFVPPSPGIRTWEAGMTYLATVFAEALPGVDIGRGTSMAFRVLGAPWLRAEPLCEMLNARRLAGVAFYPYRYVAGGPPYQGRELDGVRLAVTDPARFHPVTTSLAILHCLAALQGVGRVWRCRGARPRWFDALYGGDATRRALLDGAAPEAVAASWESAPRRYRATRRAALIYPAVAG
jgi:uncharacterized protein YbbC (DUF1343 family)